MITGFVGFLQSGGSAKGFAAGFVGGIIGGALRRLGYEGAVAGAFVQQFVSCLMNGWGTANAFKRALVSAGIVGAGVAAGMAAGALRNAELQCFLLTMDADLVVDGGYAAAELFK